MWIDFKVIEISEPNISIIRNQSTAIKISIRTTAIHFTNTEIISCNHHELTYNLIIQEAIAESVIVNATHSQTTCISRNDWNPANTNITIQTQFKYLIVNYSLWTVLSSNGTILDFSSVFGIFLLLSLYVNTGIHTLLSEQLHNFLEFYLVLYC